MKLGKTAGAGSYRNLGTMVHGWGSREPWEQGRAMVRSVFQKELWEAGLLGAEWEESWKAG